jgi:hypothetical protein
MLLCEKWLGARVCEEGSRSAEDQNLKVVLRMPPKLLTELVA